MPQEFWIDSLASVLCAQSIVPTPINLQLATIIVLQPWLFPHISHHPSVKCLLDQPWVRFLWDNGDFLRNTLCSSPNAALCISRLRLGVGLAAISSSAKTNVIPSCTLDVPHEEEGMRHRLITEVNVNHCSETIVSDLWQKNNSILSAGWSNCLTSSKVPLIAKLFPTNQATHIHRSLLSARKFAIGLGLCAGTQWVIEEVDSLQSALVCTKDWWDMFRRIQLCLTYYGAHSKQGGPPSLALNALTWFQDSKLHALVAASLTMLIVHASPSRIARAIDPTSPTYKFLPRLLSRWRSPEALVSEVSHSHHLPGKVLMATHSILCLTMQRVPHFMTHLMFRELYSEFQLYPLMQRKYKALFAWWSSVIQIINEKENVTGQDMDDDDHGSSVDSWCTTNEENGQDAWAPDCDTSNFVALNDTMIEGMSAFNCMLVLATEEGIPDVLAVAIMRSMFLQSPLQTVRMTNRTRIVSEYDAMVYKDQDFTTPISQSKEMLYLASLFLCCQKLALTPRKMDPHSGLRGFKSASFPIPSQVLPNSIWISNAPTPAGKLYQVEDIIRQTNVQITSNSKRRRL